MKKLFLIRFGNVPNPEVTNVLAKHISGRAFAGPIPGAILSVFNTESDPSTITQQLSKTGALFFLIEAGALNQNLPEGLMEAINKLTGNSEVTPQPVNPVWTLDDILDLISQNGIESLTSSQLQILRAGTV